MATHTSILLFITLWASMQDGLGHPMMNELKVDSGDNVQTHRVRTKRCACSSLLDSECHYFCHLDIIWINTPSKTTLYGLGSILSRRRRSTDRCACANPEDQTCIDFCHHSPDIKSEKKHKLSILSVLRALARSPKKAQQADDPHADKFSEAHSENTH